MTCHVCHARADANLCRVCTKQLEQAIAELPALYTELTVTVTRQDRGVGQPLYAMNARRLQQPGEHYDEGTTTLPSTPWPFSWDASNVRWTVVQTLAYWTTEFGGAPLLAVLDDIRRSDTAAQLFEEITSLREQILTAIDRPDPDLFAGRCTATNVDVRDIDGLIVSTLDVCGTELMARTGDDTVTCPRCRRVYPLTEKRAEIRGMLPDQWARAHVIADALTELEQPVNASTLRTWIERDARDAERFPPGDVRRPSRPLVLQVGVDDEGRPLYRVGDVQARIEWAREQRKAG